MHVEKNHYLVTALDEIILASTGTEKVGTTSYYSASQLTRQSNLLYYYHFNILLSARFVFILSSSY